MLGELPSPLLIDFQPSRVRFTCWSQSSCHLLTLASSSDSTDAHKILVMGNGEILESGSHNDLLNSEDGAYAKLVLAQKLAAATEKEAALLEDGSNDDQHTLDVGTPDDKSQTESKDEKLALARTNTGGASLSSQILAGKQFNEADHKAIPYRILGRRLAAINRDHWKYYIFGFVCSVATGCV